jgi:hypothetical protein
MVFSLSMGGRNIMKRVSMSGRMKRLRILIIKSGVGCRCPLSPYFILYLLFPSLRTWKSFSTFCISSLIGPITSNGASHDLTWPLTPAKCSFNLGMPSPPPPPPPPPYAFWTILAIHTTFNHLSMNPSRIFSFWGHCKFVNAIANSKAKSNFKLQTFKGGICTMQAI